MTDFYIAIAVFLLAHVIPAYKPLRNGLADALGERVFLASYGTLSTVLLVWLFWAYFEAPYQEIWAFQEWMRWVPLVAMFFSCLLITTGLGSPNPFSISFIPADKFDPSKPGIVALTRHPAIWGLFLWSTSHVVPNGDLAAVLMFSLLSLLGLYGPISLDMKRKHHMGEANWEKTRLATATSGFSWKEVGLVKILLGIVLYATLLYFHEAVIGVAPVVF